MSDKITLDRDTFKVLAADTRVNILKSIHDRKKTISDLAEEFGMSPSTIKEHVDKLVEAGLIEYLDRGTKWKYYVLTRKGEKIVSPVETKVWILLSTSLVALGALTLNIFGKISGLGKTGADSTPTLSESLALAQDAEADALGEPVGLLASRAYDTVAVEAVSEEMLAAAYDGFETAGEVVVKAAGNLSETATTLSGASTKILHTTTTLLDAAPAGGGFELPLLEFGLTIFVGVIFLATLAHVLKKRL
ncbi:MAG TPA: ArsR family transcriptional regulator [Candidatus Altiarchaeales archaeon]|nr:ArsR family transcriptional regulator [Candidatus Altiarchaeales archaeon]